MTATPIFAEKHTYVPEDGGEVLDFVQFLKASGRTVAPSVPKLVGFDGTQKALPEELFAALLQIAEALAAGRGVTVMPTDSQLTTQQAADYLGYSRPTLVKLLEEGSIPFSKVGRHRRVMLRDLIAYEDTARTDRRTALDDLAREAAADGSLFKAPGDHGTR